MRTRAALLSAAVTLALAAGASAGDKPGDKLSDVTRIRPLNEQAAALLADAQQKSATVRNLVKGLEGGDVVAYVQVVPASEGGPQSTLQFVGASRTVRFVLIQVAECKKPCRRAELLGHELQHVNEVIAASWVVNDNSLQRLLTMTGYPDSTSARGYETAAAGQVERKVRRDIGAIAGSAQ
jgi:hypothetical protein